MPNRASDIGLVERSGTRQYIKPAQSNVVPNDPTGNTWALPEGAISRLGRGSVPNMAFSPDRQYLAVGTWVGLWMYDLQTLSPIMLFETERGMVGCVAFSPNGKWIAVSNSDQILKVLDIQNGTCLTQVKTSDYVTGLTFSPNNRYLAVAYASSSTAEIYNIETGEPLPKFATNTEKANYFRPISFSPDTRLIVSTCETDTSQTPTAEGIVVWDVESAQQIAFLAAHTSWISTLCFSPCGKFIASGGEDGAVYVWDVNTWQQAKVYADYGDVYRIIPSYSPEGILRAAIVAYDETGPATITVSDLESGEQLYKEQIWGNTVEFSTVHDWGNTVEFSNGSQLAYECRHEFINVWTLETPHTRQFVHSPISFPKSAIFSQDRNTLAVKYHHEGVVLWDIASQRSRPAIQGASAGKNQFVYKSVDDKLYIASIKADNVTLWEADGDGIPLIEGMDRKYWSALPALAPTGNLFAYATEDGTLKVWDVQRGAQLYELTHPLDHDDDDEEDDGDEVRELKFSPDGRLLASESRFTSARLWNLQTGEEVDTFPSDIRGIIGFSPCSRYLFSFGEEYIQLWDIASAEMCQTSITPEQVTDEFAFSPCGQYLAAGRNEIILWDIMRCELHRRLPLPPGCSDMFPLTFSQCGSYLAAGAWWKEGVEKVPIYLWEVANGEHIATFRGHPTDVQALAFSPDNKLLASVSYDGSILLWDLTPHINHL